GRLSISQDQTLSIARFLKIGTTLGTSGAVDIATRGIVTIGGDLEIGLYGQGSVVVTDGLLDARFIRIAGGPLNIGSANAEIFERLVENPAYVPPLAQGTLEVSGPDAKVVAAIKVGNSPAVSLAGFHNGNTQHLGGHGILTISQGGQMESPAAIVDKLGIVTVRSGGQWVIESSFNVGGHMRIESGDVTVTGRQGEITPGGFFQLDAGNIGEARQIIGTLAIDG